MGPHLEPHEQGVLVHCSVCGHLTEPFGLPGRPEKFCLECSADLATALLLTAEIDAATLSGQNANPLISEFAQLSQNMLSRSQSADPFC
jgi:hypothetical protein